MLYIKLLRADESEDQNKALGPRDLEGGPR